MKTTMKAVLAVGLAFAMFAGGSARAQETSFGDYCVNFIEDDVFDGKIAMAGCEDKKIAINAVYTNNTTGLTVFTDRYMLEDVLTLRTALDGVETPKWKFRLGKTDNMLVLYIRPAIPTIKELLKHSRLQIRIIERDGETHNADIDISRFGEALAPVRELCGW